MRWMEPEDDSIFEEDCDDDGKVDAVDICFLYPMKGSGCKMRCLKIQMSWIVYDD